MRAVRLRTRPLDGPLLRATRRLRDPVTDEVDGIQPGHVLQLQEVDGVALALAEQRHQHVGPGYLVPPRRLNVYRRALHDPLETRRGLRIARAVSRETREVLVEKVAQIGPELIEIDAAGPEHGRGIIVVGQPQQEVFEGRVYVPPLAGERQGAMQRLFEITRKHGGRRSSRACASPLNMGPTRPASESSREARNSTFQRFAW